MNRRCRTMKNEVGKKKTKILWENGIISDHFIRNSRKNDRPTKRKNRYIKKYTVCWDLNIF